MFNKLKDRLRVAAFVLTAILAVLVGAVHAEISQTKSLKSSAGQRDSRMSPGEWKKILEAAKSEGKLVISGDPSEAWRKSLVDLFMQEYPEIKVEYAGMPGRNFWPRVKQERTLGQKLWDLRTGGIESIYSDNVYKGFIDPIRPILLPEIADDSKWIGGLDGLFYDKGKTSLVAYTMNVVRTTAVNLDFIKIPELKTSQQLLDSRLKGKIVIQTPTGGSSYAALTNLAYMYGESFLREFLSKQNLVITNDIRQQQEWVVRGKYPIAVGILESELAPYIKQGLAQNVVKLDDKIIPVGTAYGGITLLKDAPHPNAARIYINWLLSQKAQAIISKNVEFNSSRLDVPTANKDLAVDPANLSKYYRYSTEEAMETSLRFLPLLKELLNK